MAYVHAACLSQWRNTSRAAAQRCPICQHQYVTRSTFLRKFLSENRNSLVHWLSLMWLMLLSLIVRRVCFGIPFLRNALDKEAERVVLTTEKVCSTIVSAVPQQILMGMTDEVVCEPFILLAQLGHHIATVMLTTVVATIVGELWTLISAKRLSWATNLYCKTSAVHIARIVYSIIITIHYLCDTIIPLRTCLYGTVFGNVNLCCWCTEQFVEAQLIDLLQRFEEIIVEPEVVHTEVNKYSEAVDTIVS